MKNANKAVYDIIKMLHLPFCLGDIVMKAKDVFKNIAALLMFLIVGVFSGVAVTEYLFDTYPLMDQATVPENPIGIILIPFLALFLYTFATVILSIVLFGMKKSVRLSLLLFRRKESKVCIALRIIGYLIIIKLIYESICDVLEFKRFFVNGLCYYTSAILFVLLGMIIIISIATKKDSLVT